jgi:hypothetical protein
MRIGACPVPDGSERREPKDLSRALTPLECAFTKSAEVGVYSSHSGTYLGTPHRPKARAEMLGAVNCERRTVNPGSFYGPLSFVPLHCPTRSATMGIVRSKYWETSPPLLVSKEGERTAGSESARHRARQAVDPEWGCRETRVEL